MPVIPVNLNDISEPKPVPNGKYDLTIANAEVGESRNNKPQIRVSIGIDGHDDAPNVGHFISLPMAGDDSSKTEFKGRLLKRFLVLFKQKVPGAEGFDPEALAMAMIGAKATAELTQELERDSDGNDKPDGNVYNRLMVPKLKDEGKTATGGGVPKPPKR